MQALPRCVCTDFTCQAPPGFKARQAPRCPAPRVSALGQSAAAPRPISAPPIPDGGGSGFTRCSEWAEVTSGRPPLTASAPARPGVTCGHRRSRPCGLGTTPEKCLGPGSEQQLALIPEAPVFPLLAHIQKSPINFGLSLPTPGPSSKGSSKG